jgi:hypothetical protein
MEPPHIKEQALLVKEIVAVAQMVPQVAALLLRAVVVVVMVPPE